MAARARLPAAFDGLEGRDFENGRNPDPSRRQEIASLLALSADSIALGRTEEERAEEFCEAGLDTYDALHLACAESGRADALLTTDDRFVSIVAKAVESTVTVCNPVNWIGSNLP